MEDYLVAEFKKVDDNGLGLFAIYDGHLGHDVADYLRAHLFDNILKEVRVYMFLFSGPLCRLVSFLYIYKWGVC